MRYRRSAAASIVAALVLVACGGSESGDDETQSGSAAATTVGVTDTTAAETSAPTSAPPTTLASTPPAPSTVPETTGPPSTSAPTTPDSTPADVEAQGLATAGVLAAADFPATFTEFSPGGETQVSEESCSYRPNGPTTLVGRGGAQYGPTMQFGDSDAFVSSNATAFPDEALAQEFIGIVSLEEWGTCRADQLQQFQRDQGFDEISVNVFSRTNEVLGQSGLEAYAAFEYSDGAGNVTRAVLMSFYRLGRVVITVVEEYGALDEAESTAFFDGSYAALSAAYDRVNGLL